MVLAPKTETLPFSSARTLTKVKELTYSSGKAASLIHVLSNVNLDAGEVYERRGREFGKRGEIRGRQESHPEAY
jgi:hypothetical protein